MFLGFVKLYRRFIQDFNKISALLTSMLKTTTETPLKSVQKSNFLTFYAKLTFL